MDLVAKVEVRFDAATLVQISDRTRLIDEWRADGDRLVGLLYGSDEAGARAAVNRIGLADASISLARGHDLLAGPATAGSSLTADRGLQLDDGLRR